MSKHCEITLFALPNLDMLKVTFWMVQYENIDCGTWLMVLLVILTEVEMGPGLTFS